VEQLFSAEPQRALNCLLGEVVSETMAVTFRALSPRRRDVHGLGDAGLCRRT